MDPWQRMMERSLQDWLPHIGRQRRKVRNKKGCNKSMQTGGGGDGSRWEELEEDREGGG